MDGEAAEAAADQWRLRREQRADELVQRVGELAHGQQRRGVAQRVPVVAALLFQPAPQQECLVPGKPQTVHVDDGAHQLPDTLFTAARCFTPAAAGAVGYAARAAAAR